MVEEDPKRASDAKPEDDDGEDRAVILARRRLLVASAMIGIATSAEACDWLNEKFGASSRPCLSVRPEPCLDAPSVCLAFRPPADPQPCLTPQSCLNIAPVGPDAAAPAPCLSDRPQGVAPQPCLDTAPQVCLGRAAGRERGEE